MAGIQPLLIVDRIEAHYGEGIVLNGVSLNVFEGAVASLLGRNGTGKSTTIKAIMGIVPIIGGKIHFDGKDVTGFRPHKLARLGLGYVPEERRIFSSLSVIENLEIIAGIAGSSPWPLEKVFALFPVLAARKKSLGKQLSGGEQQMLAIARILRQDSRLLLLDEPTEGLAPLIVRTINNVIKELKDAGLTVLIVEQNLFFATEVSNHHYIMSKGKIVYEGTSDDLNNSIELQKRYLTV